MNFFFFLMKIQLFDQIKAAIEIEFCEFRHLFYAFRFGEDAKKPLKTVRAEGTRCAAERTCINIKRTAESEIAPTVFSAAVHEAFLHRRAEADKDGIGLAFSDARYGFAESGRIAVERACDMKARIAAAKRMCGGFGASGQRTVKKKRFSRACTFGGNGKTE